jgi:hypothetical protein
VSLETDYDEEVSDLLAERYTLWKAIRILIREVESTGTGDFTALVALLDASEAAAVVTMGYYPITATPDAGNVVAAGGTKAITVAAAGDYTVVCPDGCTADITSGTPSDTTVTITVDANTGDERTFGIQFFSGNMEPVTADVTQDDGYAAEITSNLSFVAAGEEQNASVAASSDWTAALSGTDAAQFSLDPASGTTADHLIVVTAIENTGAAKEATLTVTCGTASDTCSLAQDAPATPENWALASKGATPTASTSYGGVFDPPRINDGDTTGASTLPAYYWWQASSNSHPQWIQVSLVAEKSISEVDLYFLQDSYLSPVTPDETTTFSLYATTAYNVEYWNGAAWVEILSVTGNNKVWRKHTFDAVSTTAIRVNITASVGSNYATCVELQAWGV